LNNEPSENICVNSSFDGILSILQNGFLCISALLFVQTYHDRFVKQYEKSIARMTVKYIENMEWAKQVYALNYGEGKKEVNEKLRAVHEIFLRTLDDFTRNAVTKAKSVAQLPPGVALHPYLVLVSLQFEKKRCIISMLFMIEMVVDRLIQKSL
jgi:hypothetical protein